MGVRTTSKNAGPTGANSTPFVDGHLDKFYNTEFDKGDIGSPAINAVATDATGGTVNDWSDPGGNVYRTHAFTASGTFTVNSVGTGGYPNEADWMVLGGGGAGGGQYGGGGGAGGFRSSLISPGGNASDPSPGGESALVLTTGSYTITVGSGGARTTNGYGFNGGDSSISRPTITDIVCTGGGGGASLGSYPWDPSTPQGTGRPGGCGGGGTDKGSQPNPGGTAVAPPGAPTITQGYAGGNLPNSPGNGGYEAAGGGGARYVGQTSTGGNPGAGGYGGFGVNIGPLVGPANTALGYPGPHPAGTTGQYVAGGGGGAGYHPVGNQGGRGGQFTGPTTVSDPAAPYAGAGYGAAYPSGGSQGTDAKMNSGSGGGGISPSDPQNPRGYAGGSGLVVFRYKIGSAGGTKATGGLVSHTGTRTVHTFLQSGTFTVTSPTLTSIQYLVVGGGGAGGVNLQYNQGSGGGGAGGLRTSFTGDAPGGPGGSTESAVPVGVAGYSVTVGAGGAGTSWPTNAVPGFSGAPSELAYNGGTIVAEGGGGGGSRAGPQPSPAYRNGANGGSGGGGSGHDGDKGLGNKSIPTGGSVPTQGYPGGDSGSHAGGAGGGAGAAGGGGASGSGGNGGVGKQNSISGAALYYAGGGGGAGGDPASPPRVPSAGQGGNGGGGRGAYYSPTQITPAPRTKQSDNWADNGTANAGGGGGGGGPTTWGGPGARGGSGIVIITYPT